MNKSNRLGYPELRRMAPEALRMIGLPLGLADRIADVLTWTEAATGRALHAAATLDGQVTQTVVPPVSPAADDSHHQVIDCSGASLLVFAPLIVDYLAAESHRGVYSATLRNYVHPWFLLYAAYQVSRAGYRLEISPVGHSAEQAHAFWGSQKDGEQPELWVSITPPGHLARDAVSRFPGQIFPEESPLWGAVRKAATRVDEAKRTGIVVGSAELEWLTGIIKRIRVKTSARSEMQAG